MQLITICDIGHEFIGRAQCKRTNVNNRFLNATFDSEVEKSLSDNGHVCLEKIHDFIFATHNAHRVKRYLYHIRKIPYVEYDFSPLL